VWVFGFQTLRFDPTLRHAQHLPFPGFGAVQGADGHVYMYDAGTGRVGVIVNASNSRTVIGRISGGRAQDATFAPVIAPRASELWIAAAPGELTRFDLRTRRADAPIPLTDAGANASATGVVATRGAVLAVTRDVTGLALTRVDPTTHVIGATSHVTLAGAATIDGVAADEEHLWIVADGSVLDVELGTLTVTHRVPIVGQPTGGVRGAVTAAGAVWVLADNGATIGRFAPATGAVDRVVRILPATPTAFRTPASLVSDGTRVWAMVQRRDAPDDHTVRLAGYDASRHAPTTGIDLPSALFAGAAAAS
jgi:streptogramin lyase